jgi:hypothetical protein
LPELPAESPVLPILFIVPVVSGGATMIASDIICGRGSFCLRPGSAS